MNEVSAPSNTVFPAPAQFQPVQELYLRGLYLQAHDAALSIGPLVNWRGTAARLLAGQLAAQLGATKLAAWHWVRAYREQPEDPEARVYFLRRIRNTRGPLAAWTRLQRLALPDEAPADSRARWLTLQADILSQLRDFDAAEACLARAERLTPDAPAILVGRSELLARQD